MKKIILFIFFLFYSTVYAQETKLNEGVITSDKVLSVDGDVKVMESSDKTQYYVGKDDTAFEIQAISIASDVVYKKPVIDESKILNEEEQGVVKSAIKGKISCLVNPAKNDYVNDYDRGTVYFTQELRKDGTPKNRNYSFQKVVVPDGTTIKECNFTQKNPHTQSIEGKGLTFVGCNLSNIEVDPSWTLVDCNNSQVKLVKLSEATEKGITTIIISRQVEDKGIFKEVEQYEETTSSIDDYNRVVGRLSK